MKEFIDKLKSRLKEKLLEYINKANDEMIEKGHTLDFENFLGHKEAYENVLYEIVNQLAEEYKGGWIPCGERLPEKDRYVLVTRNDGSMCVAKHIGKTLIGIIECEWKMCGAYLIETDVIAWRPLPQPYKEGE